MRAYDFLVEEIISPSMHPNTMSLWHGGDLNATVKYKSGRTEYGPGLYLITKYSVAQKYAKGSRKLYMITIAKGASSDEVFIPLDDVVKFTNSYTAVAKRKSVSEYIQRLSKDGHTIRAQVLINILINENAIKPSNMNMLREFLVHSGVDYQVVPNAFGWNDAVMVVLFNMNKVVNSRRIMPNDDIQQFDLPTTFA